MTLTTCKECGSPVSTKAASCPKCGARQRRTSLVTKTVAAILVLGALLAGVGQIVRNNEGDQSGAAPAKAAADARTRLDDQMYARAYAAAQLIRSSANDPDSIRFVEAGYTDDGSIILVYRGKNAFNAMVLNRAIITRDGKSASGSEAQTASAWNRHIAGKAVHGLPAP